MRPSKSVGLTLTLLRRSEPLPGVNQQAVTNRVTVIPSFRASLTILFSTKKAVLKGRFLLS